MEVTAAILAGGLGTRLRSVVADRPKVMALINGRPFLAYLLDQLVEAWVSKVVICSGYMGETIEAAFGNFYRGLTIVYSHEREQLGTGGALKHALPMIDTDTVLVMNGDSYTDVDLADFMASHKRSGKTHSMVLSSVADCGRFGRVDINESGTVVGFLEKGDYTGPGLINAGIYLFSRKLLEDMKEGPISLERDILPSLLGGELSGYGREGRFLDIGTPESYRQAPAFFESGGLL